MANVKSDLILKRTRLNLTNDSDNQDFTGTFILPAGTQVTAGDVYQVADVAALHQVVGIRVYTDDIDDGTTLTTNWGFQQIAPGVGVAGGLNAAGVAQDFDTATGTFYPSPASNPTYFATSQTIGQKSQWTSITLANQSILDPTGPGGPMRVGFTVNVTPTQATASLVQRVIRVQLLLARATPLSTNSAVYSNGY